MWMIELTAVTARNHLSNTLHHIIGNYTIADMERLIELECIHKLGQTGVVLPYPPLFEAGNGRYPQQPYSRMVQ